MSVDLLPSFLVISFALLPHEPEKRRYSTLAIRNSIEGEDSPQVQTVGFPGYELEAWVSETYIDRTRQSSNYILPPLLQEKAVL
jgi:hypothetical protein